MDLKPDFGHAMLKYFVFDPDLVNLNHGGFGALPLPVLEACDVLTRKIESNPDYFIRIAYLPLLNAVRERISRMIGADVDDCVMVPNVANGISTVLRNFTWNSGDVLITASTAFDSITRAIRYLSDVPPHPTVSEFTLAFPLSHSAILSQFRTHIQKIKEILQRSNGAASEKPKIVAVFDSIVSNPGTLMPWKEMVQICKEESVWSVVDAAHSIGQETSINLEKSGADFWVSSCNKWLYAKRGCAVLWVPKRNQHLIKSSLPTALNYFSPKIGEAYPSFPSKFFWFGTYDAVTTLSVNAALDFRESLGGEEKINAYCHSLALQGGKTLAGIMGTVMMDSDENPGELTANMVNVRLPFPSHIRPSIDIARMFLTKLLAERKVSASVFYHNGCWWVRACAQIYNERQDFEKLGLVLIDICKEIEKDIRDSRIKGPSITSDH